MVPSNPRHDAVHFMQGLSQRALRWPALASLPSPPPSGLPWVLSAYPVLFRPINTPSDGHPLPPSLPCPPLRPFFQTLNKLIKAGGIILDEDVEVTAKMATAAARNCGKDEAEQLRLAEVLALAIPQQHSLPTAAAASSSPRSKSK